MRKLLLTTFVGIALVGCGTPMTKVMNMCSQAYSATYDYYYTCIKNEYSKNGSGRGSQEVNAFYVYLDLIAQERRSNNITEAEARFLTQKAYEKTIGEANAIKQASINQSINQANIEMARSREELNRQLLNSIGRQNNQLNCMSIDMGGIISTQCR